MTIITESIDLRQKNIVITPKETNMLPFLSKRQQQTGISQVVERKPDEGKPEESGIEAVARDLIRGIQSQDHKLVAAALQAAIELAQSPSEEAPESTEEV